jgi:3-phenylpropionate/trans-cinnamate dioxygenase ferredoxin reductase subunit
VDVRLETSVERFEGDGHVARAVLSGGETVDCALAIIGIGVLPNSELAAEAGLKVENGIVVDELCHTSDPDIFAAGDVTNHPNALLGRRIRLESWENAQNQGIAAGKSMLDRGEPYAEIPWFWSDQHDANIQMMGLPENWDHAATRGSPRGGEFVTFYLRAGLIVGAISVNNPRDLRFARRLMQAKKQVSVADLENPDVRMQSLLKG